MIDVLKFREILWDVYKVYPIPELTGINECSKVFNEFLNKNSLSIYDMDEDMFIVTDIDAIDYISELDICIVQLLCLLYYSDMGIEEIINLNVPKRVALASKIKNIDELKGKNLTSLSQLINKVCRLKNIVVDKQDKKSNGKLDDQNNIIEFDVVNFNINNIIPEYKSVYCGRIYVPYASNMEVAIGSYDLKPKLTMVANSDLESKKILSATNNLSGIYYDFYKNHNDGDIYFVGTNIMRNIV